MPSLQSSRHNNIVRLLMCGDSSAGKTSLVLRFTSNEFSHNFASTIGVDFCTHKLLLNGQDYTVQVWDTAGQERYNALTSSFFSRADGVCLAFDCTSRDSFERIQHWWNELTNQREIKTEVDVVIVANKMDLSAECRVVAEEEGRLLAESYGVAYFETSSKDGTGVKEMFSSLAELVANRKYAHMAAGTQKPNMGLDSSIAPLTTANETGLRLRNEIAESPVAHGFNDSCC